MTKRAKPLDAALKGMFRTLETRRLPEHLRRVVDQLEGRDAKPASELRQ